MYGQWVTLCTFHSDTLPLLTMYTYFMLNLVKKKKEKILVGSRAPHLLVEYILIGCKSGMGFLRVLVFLHCAVNTSNTNNS